MNRSVNAEEIDTSLAEPGVVYLVGGGPGDPELITIRGAALVRSADVVLHDELVHPSLLDGARGEVRGVGKRGGDLAKKAAKQAEIDADLVALARAGKSVVRLKGGDPFLFGRGSEEAEALAAAGVRFEIVPGVCSPLGATAYAGISVTHRDLASSVTFVSGTTRSGAMFDWSEIASAKGTVCVLMGMQKIEDVTRAMMNEGKRDPSTPCAVIQWGTRAEQRVASGPLESIASIARAAGLGSPAIIVAGAVVGLRDAIRWFDRLPLFGKRVLVPRPRGQAAATSRAIRRLGGEAIEVPLISIDAAPDSARVVRAAHELASYDACVFTSENGVDRFFEVLASERLDARAFGNARVAVIGPGTAASLAAHGVRADIMPVDYRGEALADAILADPIFAALLERRRRARVLVPRAKAAREVLAEMLRAKGCEVDIVPVYETTTISGEAAKELAGLFEARALDVVMLTSSSTATALVEALGDAAGELLGNVVVASIGPITTARAEELGMKVAVTAKVSTAKGVLEAIGGYFGRESGSAR